MRRERYIEDLRQCAKEHENDLTETDCIQVSSLCNNIANYLESSIIVENDKWIESMEILVNLCIETIDILCIHSQVKLHKDATISTARPKSQSYYLAFDYGVNSYISEKEYDTINQCLDKIEYYKESIKND